MPTADELTRGWRFEDAAFIVHYAEKCGWVLRPTGVGAVRMFAADGTERTVPSNTSLKSNVFRSWTATVWTHKTSTPSANTVRRLIKEFGLDKWHERQVWQGSGLTPPREVEKIRVPEEVIEAVTAERTVEEIKEEVRQAEAVMNHTPAPEPLVVTVDVGPIITSRIHPLRSETTGRHPGQPIEFVWERTWSDGHVDYECTTCGYTSDRMQAVQSHQRKHADQSKWAEYGSKKGKVTKAALKRRQKEREAQAAEREKQRIQREAEMLAEAAKVAEEGYPEPEVTHFEPEETPLAAASREVTEQQQAAMDEIAQVRPDGRNMLLIPARQALGVLQGILDVVAPVMIQQIIEMRAEIERLHEENRELRLQAPGDLQAQLEAAEARAAKAEGDLDALRDLLGVRKER